MIRDRYCRNPIREPPHGGTRASSLGPRIGEKKTDTRQNRSGVCANAAKCSITLGRQCYRCLDDDFQITSTSLAIPDRKSSQRLAFDCLQQRKVGMNGVIHDLASLHRIVMLWSHEPAHGPWKHFFFRPENTFLLSPAKSHDLVVTLRLTTWHRTARDGTAS